ncbi:MAG: hypothetical protein ACFB4I_15750 [Cyanophyceae cyanobacterium]
MRKLEQHFYRFGAQMAFNLHSFAGGKINVNVTKVFCQPSDKLILCG